MSKWLSRRLTPAKSKEARWAELAAVTEQIWEEFFDPYLSRLERMRSSYLADDQDLVRKIRQMGDYFSFELPNEAERPIALAWRRLELEYKDTELILRSVFRRHFGNLAVTWFPIFAPLDEPYGTEFKAAEGPWPETKNYPPDGMFLTSRGVLGIDLSCIFGLHLSKQEFLARAEPLLLRTKPLHIVYDGPLWYIRWDIPFECDFAAIQEREDELIELPFSVVGARFDVMPADARYLDQHTLSLRTDWGRTLEFPFIRSDQHRHLDFFLPEGFPETWLPLDTLLMGSESIEGPFYLACADCRFPLTLPVSPCCAGMKHESDKRFCFTASRAHAEHSSQIEKRIDHTWDTPRRHLDYFPHLDDFPADMYPLDMPIGGCHG